MSHALLERVQYLFLLKRTERGLSFVNPCLQAGLLIGSPQSTDGIGNGSCASGANRLSPVVHSIVQIAGRLLYSSLQSRELIL